MAFLLYPPLRSMVFTPPSVPPLSGDRTPRLSGEGNVRQLRTAFFSSSLQGRTIFGSYISVDTFFIWASPIEIFHNLNKIIKIIIWLRPAVSWFINFFDDFLLILIDFYAEGV